jgi:hypothetical protein
MDESTTPVVLLAFANDNDAYLQMIVKERKAIANALQDYDDRRYIKVVKEENTAVDDIFNVCTRYANRVAIFHYGGHASGTQLQLEAGGRAQLANAVGLAQLLGQQQSLQLVFLNGCATEPQVQTLFACGVKAVIATAVPVNDQIATELAEHFYVALGRGATIQSAFQSAKAVIAATHGTAREINEFRAIGSITAKEATAANLIPWGLYVNPAVKGDDALKWTLPRVAEHQVIIRGAPTAANVKTTVNVKLSATLFNALAKHSDELGVMWEAYKRTGQQNRKVRSLIAESFPTPVGEQLRKLFAANTIDVPRLQQLVLTYETIAELFCFTVLSQLWNAKHENPALSLTPEQAAAVQRFSALAAEEQRTFDYVALTEIVAAVFHSNAISPFIDEIATLGDGAERENFDRACRFMQEMRAELAQGAISADEISSFCVQAEEHLGTVLSYLAFLVRYKVATIKQIEIVKSRHKPAQYHHAYMVLEGPNTGMITENELVDDVFTDSKSVILLKNAEDAANYLSLSPFVVDQNALTGDLNSKLFFYSHRDPASGYCFRFVDNADDSLVISDENYPDLKQQFEEFAQAVGGV